MNSKIIRSGILALALSAVVVPAQAARDLANTSASSAFAPNSYESELNRYIEGQDLRGNMIKMVTTMMSQFVSQGLITAAQLNTIAEEVANAAYPRVKKATEDCLRQNLSVDELHQINAFNATPAGRKLIALTPSLMEAGNRAMQQPDIQQQVQQIVQRHLGNAMPGNK